MPKPFLGEIILPLHIVLLSSVLLVPVLTVCLVKLGSCLMPSLLVITLLLVLPLRTLVETLVEPVVQRVSLLHLLLGSSPALVPRFLVFLILLVLFQAF